MGSMSAPKAKEDPVVGALQNIGTQEWGRYKRDYAPEEKAFVEDTARLGSEGEREYLRGTGVSEVQQQAGPIELSARPGAMLGRAQKLGRTRSDVTVANTLQSREREAEGLKTAISLGRGIGSGSLGRLGRAAQLGTSRSVAKAESEGLKKQGVYDALGTAVGYGLYKYDPKSKK